jgi:2-keto-3-deoxy-L-rhamnonate aldolase RhmA
MPAAQFLLTALTRDPAVIRAADQAGVDRIGIDIERLDKHLRQDRGSGARFSDHDMEDLEIVAANVTHAELFVRINSLHAGSPAEIGRALELGAQAIMLPYFTAPWQARRFVEMVGGRAKPVLLVETAAAAARIGEIVALPGVAEIMVGLNDLHRSMGLSGPFEALTSELMGAVAAAVRDAGLRFGFGGVGRAGDETLPVAPDLVYAQYPLLNATTAWLARSFYRGIEPGQIPEAVRQLRERLAYWFAQPREVLERQCAALTDKLRIARGSAA